MAVAMKEQILSELAVWKTKRFRGSDIPLERAIEKLGTEEAFVEARAGSANTRWILFQPQSDRVAVITHAAIWTWGTHLETGNFVPEGKDPPIGISDGRMETVPSRKCEFTYAFDTTADDSLFNHIKTLENHVDKQPNFNRLKRERNPWQDGKGNRHRYIIAAKMFATRTPNNAKDGQRNFNHGPHKIHPWISDALKEQTAARFIPNPERPKLLDYVDNKLVKLEDSDPPVFRKGDIIWMSMKIGFAIGPGNWKSEIIPLDFIRVGRLSESILDYKLDYSSYPSVGEENDLEVGTTIVPFEESYTLSQKQCKDPPEGTKKRKVNDDNEGTVRKRRQTVVSDEEETLSGWSADSNENFKEADENPVENGQQLPKEAEEETDTRTPKRKIQKSMKARG